MKFATVLDPTTVVTTFVQSADAADLQARLAAAIAAVAGGSLITDITLAGGGDGHTFVVIMDVAPATSGTPATINVVGGLIPTETHVRCYLASDAGELLVARTAVTAFAAGVAIEDEQLAGAAKGTRFMGLIIGSLGVTLQNQGAFALMGAAGAVTIDGSNILTTGMDLNVSTPDAVDFDVPSAGGLRYIGRATKVFIFNASVSVLTTTPFDVVMDLVTAPLVAPVSFGLASHATLVAGLAANINVHAVRQLVTNQVVGIRMVDTAGDSIVSAHLLVHEL